MTTPAIASIETEQVAATAFRGALPLRIEVACKAARAAYRAVEEFGAAPGRAVKAALLVTSGERRP